VNQNAIAQSVFFKGDLLNAYIVQYTIYNMTDRMTRIQKCDIHLNPVKSLVQHAAPPDAHDAQLSNGPIGASIRESEKCPFNNDWADSEKQDRGLLGKIARTAPPDAHDAQLSIYALVLVLVLVLTTALR